MANPRIGPAGVFDALDGAGYVLKLMREELRTAEGARCKEHVFAPDGVVSEARKIHKTLGVSSSIRSAAEKKMSEPTAKTQLIAMLLFRLSLLQSLFTMKLRLLGQDARTHVRSVYFFAYAAGLLTEQQRVRLETELVKCRFCEQYLFQACRYIVPKKLARLRATMCDEQLREVFGIVDEEIEVHDGGSG